MRWLKRISLILLVFAALIALLLTAHEIELHRYYAARPVLSAMNEAWNGGWTEARDARAVLLKVLPLGSAESEIVQRLAAEGFRCQQRPLKSDEGIACQLLPPTRSGGPIRWVVDLEFTDARRLRDARVVALKMML